MVQSARHEPPKPAMKLWVLKPVNMLEPPFHFANVEKLIVVAAKDEDDARRVARGGAVHGAVWDDEGMTSCDELAPTQAGVIAREMT